MSLIDSHRSSTSSGKIRRIIRLPSNQISHRKQSSPTIVSHTLPGLGRELSISEVAQLAGRAGRYLRVFCEHVCPFAKFKTIFVQNDCTVSECTEKVVIQLSSEGSIIAGQFDLFEVIGRLPANSKAISESGTVNDPGEVFSELNSRPLPPEERILNIFSLMAPAPGLCRRLELRKQLSSPVSFPSRIRTRVQTTVDPIGVSSQLIAPQCPFLLLIKGSRPESDLLVHSFYDICRGILSEMTMGTSAYNNIRLYLSPEARISHENMDVNGDHRNDFKSPIRFVAKSHPVSTDSKAVWLCISSTYNVIQPEYPLTVILNWETLTETNSFPISKSLEPGDILRIEASNLIYVFIFKDSETVPEHNLPLGFLTLPQLPSIVGKPPTGQNGNRSAARTARIDALVRKTSSLSNRSACGSRFLPSPQSVGVVVGNLFPRTTPKSEDSDWSEIGGILPDVGVAAGCFAHLLRSVVKHGLGTHGQWYVGHIDEDDVFREINQALSRELEKLNKLASQHLIPAIWEAAFCYYVAQYLSPGWLMSTVSLPWRVQAVERRRTSRVRSADGNSNSSTTDSPSDVFNSPLQRPRQLYPANIAISDNGENYDPDFENLSILSALRNKVAVEAEAVMNQAVQMSLRAASRAVFKLCRLFGGASGDETAQQIRDVQAILFSILDRTGDAITQALTTRSQNSELSSGGAPAIRLTQAKPYNGRDSSRGRRPTMAAKLEMNGGDSSRDSSLRRNNSSVIDSEEEEEEEEEEEATSPSGFSSNYCDDEIHSTPGEEEDTGLGSSATGGLTKVAQQRMESVFFCRLLVKLSKRIIKEFVENRELVINWEMGTQVLNLTKALSKWMHNAGVQNHKEAMRLLYDFARLMATPRQELLNMSWDQLRSKRPALPPSLLYFLLNNYEKGKGMQSARGWFTNDENALRGNPIDAVNEYAKYWQETEQLCTPSGLQKTELAHRPPDLAALFSTVRAKMAVDSFDRALVEQHQAFRWSALLKSFRPPASVLKDSGSVCSSGIRLNSARLGSQLPDLICVKQRGSSDSSDIRDFAELNTEVNGSKSNAWDTPEIFRPTLSSEGPSRSILTGLPYNYRRATTSELGGLRRTDVQQVVPVPGGGFRSRAGAYELGASSPRLQDWCISGTASVSKGRNCARRSALRVAGLFSSNINVSQSTDLRRSQEVQKIHEDWSEFKKGLSHPTTPSTIEPDAETLNGSLPIHPLSALTQSGHDFNTFPHRGREDSLSSFMDWNLRKSQQSLISVDMDRPIASSVINVQLEKVANETYGLKFVEGNTTRFSQLGVYVKAITPDAPASRADVQLGDRILAINGKDVTGMTFKETCDLLKDCVSRVTLTIQRGLVENPDDLLYS